MLVFERFLRREYRIKKKVESIKKKISCKSRADVGLQMLYLFQWQSDYNIFKGFNSYDSNKSKQAGAELCQAQESLDLLGLD